MDWRKAAIPLLILRRHVGSEDIERKIGVTGAPAIGVGFVLLAIATAVLKRNMFNATRQWIGPLARLKFKHSDLSILEEA